MEHAEAVKLIKDYGFAVLKHQNNWLGEAYEALLRALLSASIADTAGAKPVAQWQTKLREPILQSDTWINVSEEGARKTIEKWSHVYEVRALVVAATPASSVADVKPCTCHPDDNPPIPCAKQYALSECRSVADAAGASEDALSQIAVVVKDLIECLMLWNGQAFAGLDMDALAGLRDELNDIAKESSNDLMQAAWSARDAEIAALRKERDHWKANHDAQVSRARLLIERTDMPLERVRAYEELAALRERIAGMEKDAERARWIDVETRAPECGEWVLATNGKWTGVAAYFTDVVDSDEHWQDERREFIEMLGPKVTHWMPLPDAPTP